MTEPQWKAQHRVLQRALSELEGTEYVEPQPRWVWFARPAEKEVFFYCHFCARPYRRPGAYDKHERAVHGAESCT